MAGPVSLPAETLWLFMMRITLKLKTVILLLLLVTAMVFIAGTSLSAKKETKKNSISLHASNLISRTNDLVYKKWMHQRTAVAHDDEWLRKKSALTLEVFAHVNELSALDLSNEQRKILSALKLKLTTAVHTMAADNSFEVMSVPFSETLSLLSAFSELTIKEEANLDQEARIAMASSVIGLEFQSALFIIFLLCLLAVLPFTWVRPVVYQKHELN
jgi:hypothetical protein